MKAFGSLLVFVALIFSAMYFEWWQCSQLFPHAPVACMLRGSR